MKCGFHVLKYQTFKDVTKRNLRKSKEILTSETGGYVTNSQYGQLLVGLLAQLVEHCTGVAEVMGSNPVQAWIFLGFLFATA